MNNTNISNDDFQSTVTLFFKESVPQKETPVKTGVDNQHEKYVKSSFA